MDIGKAFGQMFKDPKWVKKMLFFSLFGVLCIFLIGIPFVAGYSVLILHGYLEGKEELPEWEDNWEKILMTGLKFIAVSIVVGIIAFVVSIFTSGLLSVLSTILSETDGLEMIGMLLMVVQWIVNLVVNFVFSLVNFLVMIRFAQNLSFSQVFDFDWHVEFFRKSWTNLLIVALLSIVTGIIGSLGLLAFCIGVFLTLFYAMVTNAALLAEVAKAAGEATDTTIVSSPSVEKVTKEPAQKVSKSAEVKEEGPVRIID